MVTVAGEFVEVVYVTVQLPPDNVHEVVPNVPSALLSLNKTVPVGVTGEFDVSTTDMVSVTEPPPLTVPELDVIDVLVGCNAFVVEELFVVELDVELVLVWLSA
jgi:hypothetical protein